MSAQSWVTPELKINAVMDWDRVGNSDHLGTGFIDLVNLEPFQSTTRVVRLFDSNEAEHGSVTVKMVFRPEFVARTRAATSTFVGGLADGAMTGVGGVVGGGAHIVGKGGKFALGGAGMVASGAGHVGKGVFHGVHNVGKHVIPGHHGHRRDTLTTMPDNNSSNVEDGFLVPESAGGSDGLPGPRLSSNGVNGTMSVSPVSGGQADFGVLNVSVTSIDGVAEEGKTYASIKHGGKTLEKVKHGSGGGHDSFTIKTMPDALTLQIVLLIKKAFKDKEIGEAELDVWNHIHPGSVNSADASIVIGTAYVTLSLAWSANVGTSPVVRAGSSFSHQTTGVPESPASKSPSLKGAKSRFSLHRSGTRTESS